MKPFAFLLALMLSTGNLPAQTSSQIKVTLEQIAKLQVYLVYLKKGYDIAHNRLTVIGDIKNGDLNLHQLFFNHLKTVNPIIKRYYKTGQIIVCYHQMKQIANTSSRFIAQTDVISVNEQGAIVGVFTAIMAKMDDELEQLETVITDRSFTMSDSERLVRIDYLHSEVMTLLTDIFHIVSWLQTGISQRKAENESLKLLTPLY